MFYKKYGWAEDAPEIGDFGGGERGGRAINVNNNLGRGG